MVSEISQFSGTVQKYPRKSMLIGLIWRGGVGTKEVHGFSVYLQVSITPMQVSRENIITEGTQWRKDRSCE